MASSSSRTAIRSAVQVARQPLAQSVAVASRARNYATETQIGRPGSSSSAAIVPEGSLYGSGTGANASDQTYMKKYTGPGFPRIPGLRHLVHPHHPYLHAGPPLRDLTVALRRKGGRNESGRVVNRGVGGGHRQRLRIVDFYRLEAGEHDVVRIEYDPGRSAHIALLKSRSGARNVSVEEGATLAELEGEESTTVGKTLQTRNEVRGGWSYILAPEGLRAGSVVTSYRSGIPAGLVEGWSDASATGSEPVDVDATGNSADTDPSSPQTVDPPESGTSSRAIGLLRTYTLKPGNVLPLYLIPAGTNIHNISMTATGRMQLCRSAGSYGQIVAHHGPTGEALGGAQVLTMGGGMTDGKLQKKNGSVLVRLQSGEVRRLDPGCAATIGTVSNKEHHSAQLGKAGRSRWLGQRPKVRGVAMNACDHPHGGGRGKSKGNKHPRSVYGKPTKGVRTRRSKDKDGNKMVVSERPRGKASKK